MTEHDILAGFLADLERMATDSLRLYDTLPLCGSESALPDAVTFPETGAENRV